ncbi:MAG TPA: recombination-associated protein RdgC [Woeseiaceae bacterium]
MFRNVRLFRLNGPWPDSEHALSARLAEVAFEPCGAFAEKSTGFEPPTGDPEGSLARRVEGADLLRLRSQVRLLPAAAIEDALEARIAEFRQRMGTDPGRRERRRLKAQTRDELLPKALVRSQRTHAVVLGKERILAIDTGSDARTEQLVEHLRFAVADVDATPLAFNRPYADLLTRIFLGDAPRGFGLGNECRMCDPSDSKAAIRCSDMDLGHATVRNHLRHGMRLTHLGVTLDDVLSCTLDEKGGVGKLKLLGGDVAADMPDEDPLARFDAELALLAGTLRQLLSALEHALGGYEEGAPAVQRLAASA